MGREAYERLVEPLLTGIYAGDGARLSLGATFPQLRALEREHGCLLRGLKAREPVTPATVSPFLSMPTGLGELVEALERALLATGRVTIRRATAVSALRGPLPGQPARVTLASGEALEADAVVVATARAGRRDAAAAGRRGPRRGARRHRARLDRDGDAGLREGGRPRPLDATGYVMPRAEGRPVLACTWVSSKLAGRAPDGMALMRVFLGGGANPELPARDDATLLAHGPRGAARDAGRDGRAAARARRALARRDAAVRARAHRARRPHRGARRRRCRGSRSPATRTAASASPTASARARRPACAPWRTSAPRPRSPGAELRAPAARVGVAATARVAAASR